MKQPINVALYFKMNTYFQIDRVAQVESLDYWCDHVGLFLQHDR